MAVARGRKGILLDPWILILVAGAFMEGKNASAPEHHTTPCELILDTPLPFGTECDFGVCCAEDVPKT